MAQIEDFRPGMRVRHKTVGDGIVVWVDHAGVTVRFEKPHNPQARYTYDREWFAKQGHLLVRLGKLAA